MSVDAKLLGRIDAFLEKGESVLATYQSDAPVSPFQRVTSALAWAYIFPGDYVLDKHIVP